MCLHGFSLQPLDLVLPPSGTQECLTVLNELLREAEQGGTAGSSRGCQGTMKGSLALFGGGLSAPPAL